MRRTLPTSQIHRPGVIPVDSNNRTVARDLLEVAGPARRVAA